MHQSFCCVAWISHLSTHKDIFGPQHNVIQGERDQNAGWSPVVIKFWFLYHPLCFGGRRVFKEENTLSSWTRTVQAPKNESFQALLSCASLHIMRWTVGRWSPYSQMHWAVTGTQIWRVLVRKHFLSCWKKGRGWGESRGRQTELQF